MTSDEAIIVNDMELRLLREWERTAGGSRTEVRILVDEHPHGFRLKGINYKGKGGITFVDPDLAERFFDELARIRRHAPAIGLEAETISMLERQFDA